MKSVNASEYKFKDSYRNFFTFMNNQDSFSTRYCFYGVTRVFSVSGNEKTSESIALNEY